MGRDQVDSFTIESVDVGNLLKIRIGHDNKGGFAAWYLKSVSISTSTMEKLTFVADRWLDLKEDDGKLEVEFYNKTVQMTTYNIDVETGDKSGAGTDANVYIIIIGERCSTDKIFLENSKTHKKMFERDQVDSFTIESVDVGNVLKIRIGHDNKGGFAGWHLKSVTISTSTMEKLTFVADRWLDLKEGDGKLEVQIYALNKTGVSLDDTGELLETSTGVHSEGVCLDDTGELLATPSGGMSIAGHVEICHIKEEGKKEHSEDSEEDSEEENETDAMKLFKKFDVDGDGR